MKVFVYFNLHKKCWSVKALEGECKGRVIMHEHTLTLKDVTFRVSAAGRQRVLAEKRKNVHAGVVGTLADASEAASALASRDWSRVSYNPYKAGHFVNSEGNPVYNADFAAFSVDRRLWAI